MEKNNFKRFKILLNTSDLKIILLVSLIGYENIKFFCSIAHYFLISNIIILMNQNYFYICLAFLDTSAKVSFHVEIESYYIFWIYCHNYIFHFQNCIDALLLQAVTLFYN